MRNYYYYHILQSPPSAPYSPLYLQDGSGPALCTTNYTIISRPQEHQPQININTHAHPDIHLGQRASIPCAKPLVLAPCPGDEPIPIDTSGEENGEVCARQGKGSRTETHQGTLPLFSRLRIRCNIEVPRISNIQDPIYNIPYEDSRPRPRLPGQEPVSSFSSALRLRPWVQDKEAVQSRNQARRQASTVEIKRQESRCDSQACEQH